jgi:hypothetical protein
MIKDPAVRERQERETQLPHLGLTTGNFPCPLLRDWRSSGFDMRAYEKLRREAPHR